LRQSIFRNGKHLTSGMELTGNAWRLRNSIWFSKFGGPQLIPKRTLKELISGRFHGGTRKIY
jgi:hypothetical protein